MICRDTLITAFRQLKPLASLSEAGREQLAEKAMTLDFNTNETLIRKLQGPTQLYHYLLEGEIEYRVSMMERTHLYHSTSEDWCRNPLEELIEEKGGSIRAKTNCRLLVLSKSYVDELLKSSLDTASLPPRAINANQAFAGAAVEHHHEQDWSEVFLNTPLVAKLPPTALQKVFRMMKDQTYCAGEIVAKENTPSDSFFLIKSGRVEMSNSPAGPLEQPIELRPGNYFGDESLIAGTPGSFDVRMLDDGVLGCLDRCSFNEVFRQSLVKTIGDREISAMRNDRHSLWIDVRLPAEFRRGHMKDSVNLPVGSLRKHLAGLDASSRYFVCANGGSRSELATYLLCQHGLDAYMYQDDMKVVNG